MINFIQNNPFVAILSATGIVALLLLFIFLRISKKNDAQLKKIRKAKKEAQAPKVEQAIKKEAPKFQPKVVTTSETNWTESYVKKRRKLESFIDTSEEDDEKEKKKKEKKFSKSKFNGVFVFKRTTKRCDMPDYARRKEEKDLLGRMEFVKSGKTVSRLAKRQQMLQVPVPKPVEPEPVVIQEPVKTEQEIKEEERKNKYSKYFNKERRLSRYINSGDYDSLFSSHISDAYMNIDMDRHLRLDYKFNKRLFDRAARTISYGEIKINDDKNLSEKAYRKSWLKQRRREERSMFMNEGNDYLPDFLDEEILKDEIDDEYIDDYYNEDMEGYDIRAGVDLAPKNLLAVDSILYRKNNYRRGPARQNRNSRNTTGGRK
ncbi:MAG: hypothetical protein IJX17_04530 [Clostridia bacterium]|nr:hypothetical protein [Clostridia bacterium]